MWSKFQIKLPVLRRSILVHGFCYNVKFVRGHFYIECNNGCTFLFLIRFKSKYVLGKGKARM